MLMASTPATAPRLRQAAALEAAVSVPLVLHGASGISDEDLTRCVELGVRKVNVNTEIGSRCSSR